MCDTWEHRGLFVCRSAAVGRLYLLTFGSYQLEDMLLSHYICAHSNAAKDTLEAAFLIHVGM